MREQDVAPTETPKTTAVRVRPAVSSLASRIWRALLADVRGARVWAFGAAALVLAGLVTLAYYLNQPFAQMDPDTVDYTRIANVLSPGHLVDPIRTPGYPLVIRVVYLVAGQGNLMAVGIAQGVLYALACLGVYALALRLTGRAWVAFLIAALLDTNVLLLSYVKPIMSEALALFLVTMLALVVARHTRNPSARCLWTAAGLLLALTMTRPEWFYFVVPCFGFLLLVSWRRGKAHPHLRHAALALVALYAVCGFYAYENGALYGTPGFSVNHNNNWLGKIMQYHMQNEASPQYTAITREVNAYVAAGDYDALHVISHDPNLLRDHMALAGTYSRAIVTRHPVEFVLKTVPIVFQSLQSSRPHQPIIAGNPFAGPLGALRVVSSLAQESAILFPFLALGWWAWLLRRRRTFDERTALLCGLALIAGYGLLATSLLGYIQYPRLNTQYDPLILTVVWVSVALALPRVWSWARHRVAAANAGGEETR